ncbi:GNAT family N-acetyltransferase [uncultured Sulfitobacter sp.]|uniref:GNAT family N-acetyltransferase n=1 Tax=uncultured Sulfitobacter sp. TaxID=191468 RepID=UPI0030FAC644
MDITHEFFPGAIGQIIQMHGVHYAKHWGFTSYFEAKVADQIAKFTQNKQDTDLVLIARDDQGVAASLILDLHDPESGTRGAHLRWFICADRCRGTGMGRKLMSLAVAHAETHSNGKMWLTTFAGLEPALHLYRSFGFVLHAESEGDVWGTVVNEQEYHRAGNI